MGFVCSLGHSSLAHVIKEREGQPDERTVDDTPKRVLLLNLESFQDEVQFVEFARDVAFCERRVQAEFGVGFPMVECKNGGVYVRGGAVRVSLRAMFHRTRAILQDAIPATQPEQVGPKGTEVLKAVNF